jgi:hypothetical protein
MHSNLGIVFILLSLLSLQHAYAAKIDAEDSSPRKKFKIKKEKTKLDRMTRLLSVIESKPYSFGAIRPSNGSHHLNGQAIFAACLGYQKATGSEANAVATARKVGYKGDIVVALSAGGEPHNPNFMKVLMDGNCIIYYINIKCTNEDHDMKCNLDGQESSDQVSMNMIRYYLYQFWASLYEPQALIMLSDFRDVLFQSNPFEYKTKEWIPPTAQLTVFQEAYPNKVIGRCPFNGGWIKECYGEERMLSIASNMVSCSGVTFGSRNAVLIYAYLLVLQMDPKVRYGKKTNKDNKGCISLGMDQGFHNWLLYSGALERYMDVKYFKQGEGPVNTVGAFFPGALALLKFNLTEWKVLKGKRSEQYFYNWNGDKSPVVHQYDRFKQIEFKMDPNKYLGALQGI